MRCSIFIASSTTSSARSSTLSPSLHRDLHDLARHRRGDVRFATRAVSDGCGVATAVERSRNASCGRRARTLMPSTSYVTVAAKLRSVEVVRVSRRRSVMRATRHHASGELPATVRRRAIRENADRCLRACSSRAEPRRRRCAMARAVEQQCGCRKQRRVFAARTRAKIDSSSRSLEKRVVVSPRAKRLVAHDPLQQRKIRAHAADRRTRRAHRFKRAIAASRDRARRR